MVNIPIVQQISAEIPQVQFLVFWEVVDMPVYVQRLVPFFQLIFHIFYVNVDSDPEAEFALENLNIISMSSIGTPFLRQSTSFWKKSYFLREGAFGGPRAGAHWKSGHYSYEGGQAV